MEKRNKKILYVTLMFILIFTVSFALLNKKTSNGKVRLDINSNSTATSSIGAPEDVSSGNAAAKIVTAKNDEPMAYINDFRGAVSKRNGTMTGSVSTGMTIGTDDFVITGPDGEAEIIFADNSIVRLNGNTTLGFTKLDIDSIETSLVDGEIWVRILKPIYDKTFFSIKTSDLSAGVRGTSVYMLKSSRGTDIKVIDSFSKIKGEEGIIVKLQNRKSAGDLKITPENGLSISAADKNPKLQSFKTKDVLTTDFIRTNTSKDIIYMDNLKKKIRNNAELKSKIQGELTQSLPTKEEIPSFFKEKAVREKVQRYMNRGGSINPNAIIQDIKKEHVIVTARGNIEQNRKLLKGTSLDGNRKKLIEQLINENQQLLDETLKGLDAIQEPEPVSIKPALNIVQPKVTPIRQPTPLPLPTPEPTPQPAPLPVITPTAEPAPQPKPSLMSDETAIR